MGEPIVLVEIDVPVCSLTYGTAPCTAAIPTTGDIKCFNTPRTCQDREHYTRAVKVLRICTPTPNLPYDAIPSLIGVDLTPAKLDPGRSIGVRASVKVSAAEHPTSDALLDKYVAERGYDPFTRGMFWAKLRARVPSMEGYSLRVLRGEVGDALEDMRTEHYFVTAAATDASGITIQAKDALAFCDAKKAQCPVPTTGRLNGAASGSFSTFTLRPAGVGDLEYAASGYVCLSNKEIIEYTRAADVFTVVGRAAFGSTQQDHNEDAGAQQVKVFDAQSVADITYDLLVNFTPGIEAGWADLPTWQAEADAYVGHLYTTAIAAPTEVNTLLNEVLSQAGSFIWWDPAAEQLYFRSLRPVAPGAFLLTDDQLKPGLAYKEQNDKRLSQVLTFYALADYTNKVDKEANLRTSILTLDPDADFDYDGLPAIGKNLSRWITIDNRAAAERLNNMQLSRYRDPPREFKFSLWAANGATLPELGEGVNLNPRALQDVTGAPLVVPAIITSKDQHTDWCDFDAEELNFSDSLTPEGDRSVFIDSDHFNLDLRDLYDSLYSSVPYGATITFYLSPGAYVGSTNGAPSMTVGDWDDTDSISLVLVVATADNDDAGIAGYGGNGGGYPGTFAGQDGGTALYTRFPITVTNLGIIGGGGGGGEPYVQIGGPDDGQAGGGGGAGFNGYASPGVRRGGLGGNGRAHGVNGTLTTGGPPVSDNGHFAGDGGNLGADGEFNNSGSVGYTDAGVAIDGVSYITFTDADDGDVRGAQIN